MTSILFVDDDGTALEEIERRFAAPGDDWVVRVAQGGEQGLDAITESDFDVVVAELAMSEVDGARVLEHARDRRPGAVRIMMSTESDTGMVVPKLAFAHQLVGKPCAVDDVRAALDRARALRCVLENEEMRHALGRVERLPTIPALYTRLTEALERGEATLEELARIIAGDAVVVARVLQVANSPLFGFRTSVEGIDGAVSRLGTAALRGIVLSTTLFDPSWDLARDAVGLGSLGRDSELTGAVALRVARSAGVDHAAAFSAGIMHDLGKLVLAIAAPDEFITALMAARLNSIPLVEAEQAANGFTHADAGGYLLSLWGLPLPVASAVAHHHAPRRVSGNEGRLAGVVYLAEYLAREAVAEVEGGKVPDLDLEHLASIGLTEELDDWRAHAAELVGGALA